MVREGLSDLLDVKLHSHKAPSRFCLCRRLPFRAHESRSSSLFPSILPLFGDADGADSLGSAAFWRPFRGRV